MAAEANQEDQKELRKRRARMLRSQQQETKAKAQIAASLEESTNNLSMHYFRLYLVLGAAITLTLFAILKHVRPRFLYGDPSGKKIPPFNWSSIYPPGVIPDRDLPRFFRTYSIATPENEQARLAVSRAVRSRSALRKAGPNYKIYLKTWDASSATMLLNNGLCGGDFAAAYHAGSEERKNDLIMWCMLGESHAEGFFLNSEVEFIDSPLSLTQGRGIVVKADDTSSSSLLSTIYMHPRNLRKPGDYLAVIPSKVLSWMLDHPQEESDSQNEYRDKMSDYLQSLIYDGEGTEDNFMILNEICQPYMPKRTVGKTSCEGSSCCYIVVPEEYGGFMNEDDSSSED